jgi:MFS family permease
MQDGQTIRDEAPGLAEQYSTRIAFFVAGFGMAACAPLVPFAKARTGVEEGALGLLLCLGAGSIISMPIAGALAGHYGCRIVLLVSSLLICLSLPPLATAPTMPILFLALFLLGAGAGFADCVSTIQAVIVERASGRSLMPGFHGLFSVGGIVGAGGVAAFLALGAAPLTAIVFVVIAILVTMMVAVPNLLPYGSQGDGPAFAVLHGVVLFIAALCFIVFMAEGTLLDWSAVFLTSVHKVDPSYAGLGYAAFAATMTIRRLVGDGVVRRLGSTNHYVGWIECRSRLRHRNVWARLGIRIVRLRARWSWLLKHRTDSIYGCRTPDTYAGTSGRFSNFDNRLRRNSCGSCSNWVHRLRQL